VTKDEYLDRNGFPLTTQRGLTLNQQMMIDGHNLDELRELIESKLKPLSGRGARWILSQRLPRPMQEPPEDLHRELVLGLAPPAEVPPRWIRMRCWRRLLPCVHDYSGQK
jgi:hypothetical protein